MYIRQADLFWGADPTFVKQVMDSAIRESYEEGQYLFHEGDPAGYFFILLKGRVKLSIGKAGEMVYIVNHAGEAFGWSSLIGRESYSASAECREPTMLLRFDREILQKLLEEDSTSQAIFFKRLAEMLGKRLLNSYKMISARYQAEILPLAGTGQVQEPETVA
jgi:CRP-like cAMP-binding protein